MTVGQVNPRQDANSDNLSSSNNQAASGLTRTFTCVVDQLQRPFRNARNFISQFRITRPRCISPLGTRPIEDYDLSAPIRAKRVQENVIDPNAPIPQHRDAINGAPPARNEFENASFLSRDRSSYPNINNDLKKQPAEMLFPKSFPQVA